MFFIKVYETNINFTFKITQTDAHDPSKCFTCEKGTDVAQNSIWDTCLHLAQQKVINKQALSIRIVDSTNNVLNNSRDHSDFIELISLKTLCKHPFIFLGHILCSFGPYHSTHCCRSGRNPKNTKTN